MKKEKFWFQKKTKNRKQMSKSGGGSSLSSGVQDKYQRISWGEIRHVQNLIERCVQRYMTQVRLL